MPLSEQLNLLLAVDRRGNAVPDIVVPGDLEDLLVDVDELRVALAGENELAVLVFRDAEGIRADPEGRRDLLSKRGVAVLILIIHNRVAVEVRDNGASHLGELVERPFTRLDHITYVAQFVFVQHFLVEEHDMREIIRRDIERADREMVLSADRKVVIELLIPVGL